MDESELIKRAQKLIRRYDDMKIVGSRGEWSGDARQGFKFNPLDGSGGGGGGSGGGGPPPAQRGACCLDGDCFETTEVGCTAVGGTYQGNGTHCSDPEIDCTEETTGACCHGSVCTIETQTDCESDGGLYQGDNSTCDPNPCACCPYTGFIDFGTFFQRTVITVSETVDCPSLIGSGTNEFFWIGQGDPNNECQEYCFGTGGTTECHQTTPGVGCCENEDCSGAYTDCHWNAEPCSVDLTCFGLFDNLGLGWCCTPSFTPINNTTTSGTCHCVCGGDPGASVTITITLEGPCVP